LRRSERYLTRRIERDDISDHSNLSDKSPSPSICKLDRTKPIGQPSHERRPQAADLASDFDQTGNRDNLRLTFEQRQRANALLLCILAPAKGNWGLRDHDDLLMVYGLLPRVIRLSLTRECEPLHT
jgi:hypothetical protein